MLITNELLNKYQGTLVGLAVGDALGTTLEFKRPGTFEPINDLVGGGPFKLEAGKWTDDTSMALCLAKSLIEKGFDPYDQMDKYVDWLTKGYMSSVKGKCVDIGLATHTALREYIDGYHPFCGSEDRNSAGNGSIMRLTPVPMLYRNDSKENILRCEISSKTTHRAPQSLSACRLFGHQLWLALNSKSKEEILADYSSSTIWKNNPLDEEIQEIAAGSYKHKNPPEIVGSGYVVKSLEAALWAFHTTDNFKDGALKAVNLGNDADTTGAIYGQLAGAYYGYDALPLNWVIKIHLLSDILDMSEELLNLSNK